MIHPKVRNIPFAFGDDTPFQWNPANPLFGFAMNSLSFIAPPFERYMVAGVRQAMSRIEDPEMKRSAFASPCFPSLQFARNFATHCRGGITA